MEEKIIPHEGSEKTPPNLNTYLISLLLAVSCFIGAKTIDTSEKVAAIQAGQITRVEVSAQIEEIRRDYIAILVRVTALEKNKNP